MECVYYIQTYCVIVCAILLYDRDVYPEFLPSTVLYRRDHILEKLQRRDMLKRRAVINIPEFYVGQYFTH